MTNATAPALLLQQCAAGGCGRGARLLHGVKPCSGARHAHLLARGRVQGLVRPLSFHDCSSGGSLLLLQSMLPPLGVLVPYVCLAQAIFMQLRAAR
jgi:hypothetical protein